jgi:hypothetical protein
MADLVWTWVVSRSGTMLRSPHRNGGRDADRRDAMTTEQKYLLVVRQALRALIAPADAAARVHARAEAADTAPTMGGAAVTGDRRAH